MHNLSKMTRCNGMKRTFALLSAVRSPHWISSQNLSDIRFLTKTDASDLKRGRGGRSSFSGLVVTVFGCTGFMGRYVINNLGKTGTQMIVPYRGEPYFYKHLKPLGDLGQILFTPYHLNDEDSIKKAVRYSDVVVNMVGRDWKTRNFSFTNVHVDGARRIARICKEMGVERLIHFSALNSNLEHKGYYKKSGSQFLQTKGLGEKAVLEEFPSATIFRPSDTFGYEDRFLHYFGRIARRHFRYIPVVQNGEDIWKQPVYVGDVAQGITNAILDPSTAGQVFEAVGPRRYELCELVDYFYRLMRRDETENYQRVNMAYDPIMRIKAILNEELNFVKPFAYLTIDKIEREAVTDTTMGLPTLQDLGVHLTYLEDQADFCLKNLRINRFYEDTIRDVITIKPPKFIEPAHHF